MTKLDEMWVEVAKYQDIADDNRHGDTWAEMCRLRTVEACRDAAAAADYAAADAVKYAASKYAAAKYAATAASKYAAAKYAASKYAAANAAAAANTAAFAAATGYADYAEIRAQEAIDFINKAIELADQWQNFCSILFNREE